MRLTGIADIYFRGVLCRYYRFVAMDSFTIFIIRRILGIMALISDFGIVCLGPTINIDYISKKCRNYKPQVKDSDGLLFMDKIFMIINDV